MPGTRLLTRLVIIVSAAFGWLCLAVPAHAADEVSVVIGGLSSSLTAGGRGDVFSTALRNRRKTEYPLVRRVFVIRLAGLAGDGVQISRGPIALPVESADAGQVRIADPLDVRLAREGERGSAVSTKYEITFTASAPGGRAEVILQAFADGRLLGSDRDTVTIRGGLAVPTSGPTVDPAADLASPQPQPSLAPLDDDHAAANDGGGSGIPTIFYMLGALMVAAGGGILWLLFREPRPALVAEDGAPGGPGTPGTPAGGRAFPVADPRPTTVLPVLGDRYQARHGGPPDPGDTQQFGANPGRPRG